MSSNDAIVKTKQAYKPERNLSDGSRVELTLKKGEAVEILAVDDEWLKGRKEGGEVGWFPRHVVKDLRTFTFDATLSTPRDPPPRKFSEANATMKVSTATSPPKERSGNFFTSLFRKSSKDGLKDLKNSKELAPEGEEKEKKKKKEFKILGKGKGGDETSGSDPPSENRTTVYANCMADLPEDIAKKIRKAKIDDDKLDANFEILCNVLRFTTKRNIVRDKRGDLKATQESTIASASLCNSDERDETQSIDPPAEGANAEKKPAEEKVTPSVEPKTENGNENAVATAGGPVPTVASAENPDIQKAPRKKPAEPSDSNLQPELLKAAEPTIFYQSMKKLYKKAEFTGKGGFGRVFYAKSTLDKGEKVAIKKMPHSTPKEKRMNIDEIAVLHFCNHPNIVKYFRSYIWENEASIVMEYMEGGSLSEAARRFDFEDTHIAYIAREMLKGISYLHKNNLVHRDLKSANVMLSIKGDIKLIDFGLAVDINKCRVHMVGSPFWMPPEMIQTKPHGFPADIWSFAICLIEMADKRPPNRKARIKAMFTTATEGLIPYVKERNEKPWSEKYKDFLISCLDLDPSKRATADQLLQHSFIELASPQKAMESVLREIFLSSAFEHSGFFI